MSGIGESFGPTPRTHDEMTARGDVGLEPFRQPLVYEMQRGGEDHAVGAQVVTGDGSARRSAQTRRSTM